MNQDLLAVIESRKEDRSFRQTWGYSSRVSVPHRYICVAVAKVGSTTIKRTLHEFEGLSTADVHESGWELMLERFTTTECAQMLTADDWLRFGFVRNPYDRLFSAWKSKIANTSDTQYEWLREDIRRAFDYRESDANQPPLVEFADFVRYLAETDDPKALFDGHYNQQTAVLQDDLIPYDQLGRFECFVEDFTAILQRLHAPAHVVSLACEVTNPTHQQPLTDVYDHAVADLAYHKYEADFEAFGYKRDSWRGE